jgi:hypothetical protein
VPGAYDADEAGSVACRNRGDARTHVATVPQGSERTIHAQVSNARVGASAVEEIPLRVDLHGGRADGGVTIDAVAGQVADPLGFRAFAARSPAVLVARPGDR